MPAHRRTPPGPERRTPWLWLPVALSTTLLVLFAVVVNRQQAQAQRIGELSNRVRALEQSRALERTAVLEQQLRAMLSRLQELEKQTGQLDDVATTLRSLREEVTKLRRLSPHAVGPQELPAPAEEIPRLVRPELNP